MLMQVTPRDDESQRDRMQQQVQTQRLDASQRQHKTTQMQGNVTTRQDAGMRPKQNNQSNNVGTIVREDATRGNEFN